MEFIEFELLVSGIRDGSINPGFMFSHYNIDDESGDDDWEFGGERVLSFAVPTPFAGGWWGEPYQGNYVYRLDGDLVFLDDATEGDGDEYAQFLGFAESSEALNEMLVQLIVDQHVEMHFAFERDYQPALVPKEYLDLAEVAVDSAWMRFGLPEAKIDKLAERLKGRSPVYRAFCALLSAPSAPEWSEYLAHAKEHFDFSLVYERHKGAY